MKISACKPVTAILSKHLSHHLIFCLMKKILLAVAVLTALVSCSKETVVDVNRGKNISFRTSLDNSLTRTNQIGLNNLKAFKVTAIGNGTSYFDDMKVTYSNDEQTWKTEYSYPWVDYTLAFSHTLLEMFPVYPSAMHR